MFAFSCTISAGNYSHFYGFANFTLCIDNPWKKMSFFKRVPLLPLQLYSQHYVLKCDLSFHVKLLDPKPQRHGCI